ncbi:MAG: hypothetical protein RLZZ338_2080 [Cyanobacteriota bacterium]
MISMSFKSHVKNQLICQKTIKTRDPTGTQVPVSKLKSSEEDYYSIFQVTEVQKNGLIGAVPRSDLRFMGCTS